MKKLILTMALALTVSASQLFAKGDDVYIRVNNESKVFSIHHNTAGLVKLKVKNSDGVVVYSVSARKDQPFAKAFDMSKLATGNYTLVVEDVKKLSSYKIDIYNDSLVLDKENTSVIFKPSVVLNERSLDISLFTINENGADISIYNDQNEMVHSNSTRGQQINKRFDLSLLESGQYTVLFNVGKESINRSIVLK